MPPAAGPVRAIGRLAPEGPWVGFQSGADGYRLVFGLPDGSLQPDTTTDPSTRRAGLVAAAIAFFLASLNDPPSDQEATQADLASLMASVAAGAGDSERGAAQEALDAIDDGIQADSVALRLQVLLPPGADAVEILRDRFAQLLP